MVQLRGNHMDFKPQLANCKLVPAPPKDSNEQRRGGLATRLNLLCGRRQHGKGLPLYMVIDVLAKESVFVELYEEMLLQNHSLRARKRTYTALNAKLFSLWEQQQASTISTKDLILQCAKLYSDFNLSKFTNNADDVHECELEEE